MSSFLQMPNSYSSYAGLPSQQVPNTFFYCYTLYRYRSLLVFLLLYFLPSQQVPNTLSTALLLLLSRSYYCYVTLTSAILLLRKGCYYCYTAIAILLLLYCYCYTAIAILLLLYCCYRGGGGYYCYTAILLFYYCYTAIAILLLPRRWRQFSSYFAFHFCLSLFRFSVSLLLCVSCVPQAVRTTFLPTSFVRQLVSTDSVFCGSLQPFLAGGKSPLTTAILEVPWGRLCGSLQPFLAYLIPINNIYSWQKGDHLQAHCDS